jgi:ABC-type multidrug transport system fused ATPase/permease subunit
MVAPWFRMIIDVMQAAAPAVLILAGGYFVVNHHTSTGTVFVFATVLTARLGQSLSQLADNHVNVTVSVALFRWLFPVIDNPHEIQDPPDAVKPGAVRGAGGGDRWSGSSSGDSKSDLAPIRAGPRADPAQSRNPYGHTPTPLGSARRG